MLSTTYDNDADALYIRFSNEGVASTLPIGDDWTLADVDAAGDLVGVEVLHPGREWPIRAVLDAFAIDSADRKLLEVMFPALGAGRVSFSAADQVLTGSTRQLTSA